MGRKRHRNQISLIAALSGIAVLLALGAGIPYLRAPSYSVKPLESVEDFALHLSNGRFFRLRSVDRKSVKAIVIISMTTGCPILRNTYAEIESIKRKYEPHGVQFYFLNPNRQDDLRTIAAESQRHGLTIPVLMDPSQTISYGLQIRRSAEALVINPADWGLIYRGAIQDRQDYDGEKSKASTRYLDDFLDAFSNKKAVPFQNVETLGCAISYQLPQKVTYSEIAPILKSKCIRCHRPGRVEPTNFSDYESVRGWSQMIRETIRTKRMPTSDYDRHLSPAFDDKLLLTPDEEAKIIRWVELGAPDAGDSLASSNPSRKGSKAKPDLSFEIDLKRGRPKSDNLLYFDLGEAPDDFFFSKYRVAVEGDPTKRLESVRLAVSDGLPTHGRRHNAQSSTKILTSAIGFNRVRNHGSGFAFKLAKGRSRLLYLHFLPGDRSKISVRLDLWQPAEGEKVRELSYSLLRTFKKALNVPAGVQNHQVRARAILDRDQTLVSMRGHMHKHGQSFKTFVKEPGKDRQLLLSVSNFNYARSGTVKLKEPLHLKRGTWIEAIGTFSNLSGVHGKPADLRFGYDFDENEMFNVWWISY